MHIVGREPTAEERAAVDALLGPPDVGLGGRRARRRPRWPHRARRPARRRRAARDLLLPALHAVQDRVGWVSRGALNYICRRLIVPPAEAWGVLTFYHLFATEPRPPVVAHVCDDIACRVARRRGAVRGAASSASGPSRRQPRARPPGMRSPCLGQCDRAPAALIVRAGDAPPTRAVLTSVGDADRGAGVVRGSTAGTAVTLDGPAPARCRNPAIRGSPLLRRVGVVDPASLDAYRAHGGYQALARAIEIGPKAVIAEVHGVEAARPRRRGVSDRPQVGGGGRASRRGRTSSSATPTSPSRAPSRIACCCEEDPFAIVEAMTICGLATGCEQGFLYLRGEYPARAASCRRRAIDAARAAGLLGDDVAGSGIRFDIEIRRGAGAYICGEETALFNSLEGKRGEPRSKPPFPGAGRPLRQADRGQQRRDAGQRASTSCSRAAPRGRRPAPPPSTGTRLFCLSGHVARPGLYEVAVRPARCGELIAAGRRRGGRAAAAGGAARRRRRHVRRARGARRAAHLRGRARGRRDARLGRRDGVRRHAPICRDTLAASPSSSRDEIVRPVRAVPGRAPCGRASCSSGCEPAGRTRRSTRRGCSCSPSSARRCATRRSAVSARRPRRRSSPRSRACTSFAEDRRERARPDLVPAAAAARRRSRCRRRRRARAADRADDRRAGGRRCRRAHDARRLPRRRARTCRRSATSRR